MIDVVIVGAGPAGLSAALLLGRCRRRVLLCGSGRTRNAASQGIHGLLGHEHQRPADYIEAAKGEIAAYPGVSFRACEIIMVEPRSGVFWFRDSEGTEGLAKKVLLATGIADEVPNLPDIDLFYGRSIHHCLYCDGFEHADQPLAAFGIGDKGAGLALMMKRWSLDVALCTGGGELPSAAMGERLHTHKIEVFSSPIAAIDGDDGSMRRIRFENGSALDRTALFFSTGCHQRSNLSQTLGCARDKKTGVITDPLTEETTVPGVYVAGDVSRDVLLIAVAVAEGAKAAVAINRALLTEEGLL